MADKFSIDASELDQLSAALGAVAKTAGSFIRSAVEVTSRNVKDHWRDQSKGLPHAPAFPFSISYDVSLLRAFGVSVIQSEIGPDKEKPQGSLGNLIEYGSVNNPPQGLGHAALQANEADFAKGLSMAIADAERKAGL